MPIRVAVIYGGRSGEHDVSLRSAEAIVGALDPTRFEVLPLFLTREGRWEPRALVPQPGANPDIDVVFPVLHGTFGEDGTIQGLLELADLPYVGAGVLGSAACMDKDLAKRVDALEERYDAQFKSVFYAIRELTAPLKEAPRRIGFQP